MCISVWCWWERKTSWYSVANFMFFSSFMTFEINNNTYFLVLVDHKCFQHIFFIPSIAIVVHFFFCFHSISQNLHLLEVHFICFAIFFLFFFLCCWMRTLFEFWQQKPKLEQNIRKWWGKQIVRKTNLILKNQKSIHKS